MLTHRPIALIQGLPAPVFGAMVENASLFLVYSELQSLIRRVLKQPITEKSSLPQLALAAAGAGMFTSFLLFVFHLFWFISSLTPVC